MSKNKINLVKKEEDVFNQNLIYPSYKIFYDKAAFLDEIRNAKMARLKKVTAPDNNAVAKDGGPAKEKKNEPKQSHVFLFHFINNN